MQPQQQQEIKPALAKYRAISEYSPGHGDIIIITHWLSVEFGIVLGNVDGEVAIILAGHPRVLFTMHDSDQAKRTRMIKLSDLRENRSSRYSIMKNEKENGNVFGNTWYI